MEVVTLVLELCGKKNIPEYEEQVQSNGKEGPGVQGDGGWVLEEYFNNIAHANQKLGVMTILYGNSYVQLALRHLASLFYDTSAESHRCPPILWERRNPV